MIQTFFVFFCLFVCLFFLTMQVCCERRLDVDLESTEDMRKKLDIWMKITTTFEGER